MTNEKRLIDIDAARRRIIAFATGLHSEVLSNVLREFAAKPMQGSFLKWLQQPAE